MSIVYNKLVRDKIPEIIKSDNREPVTHIADDEEYGPKLNEKLVEEVNEYIEEENSKEIADIYEVIDAIIEYKQFDKQEILKSQENKREKRGGFEKRIILEETR